VGKPDGLYPHEPDTCSNSYVACYSGVSYPQVIMYTDDNAANADDYFVL